MERFNRSWALAKQSFAVLKSNPSLVAFPIVSTLVSLVISASFFIPFYMIFGKNLERDNNLPPAAYPLLFLFYVVSYFIVIFFNAGLTHCADAALRGQRTSFGDGFAAAARKAGPILGWAVISATIGMILRSISERSGIIGKVVTGLIGGAWTIITYFVVPSMVLDGMGPIKAIKQSAMTLKRTWGEALIGGVSVSLAMGLLMIPAFVLIAIGAVSGSIGLLIAMSIAALLWIIVLATISASLQGIYITAMYTYTQTNQVPVGFDGDMMRDAFVSKPNAITKFRDRF